MWSVMRCDWRVLHHIVDTTGNKTTKNVSLSALAAAFIVAHRPGRACIKFHTQNVITRGRTQKNDDAMAQRQQGRTRFLSLFFVDVVRLSSVVCCCAATEAIKVAGARAVNDIKFPAMSPPLPRCPGISFVYTTCHFRVFCRAC